MKQWVLIFSVLSAAICNTSFLYASCPERVPNEIYCDDFDSYCDTGGPPGTADCADGSKSNKPKLLEVWYPLRDSGCWGTDMAPGYENAMVIADIFSGRYHNAWYMGQVAVRDWVLSPEVTQPGQVLDIHRFIQKVHGVGSNAVNGTNDAPLVMTFMMAANLEKLYYSSGYMELAAGEHYDHLNRANTDFITQRANCCGDPVRNSFPVICAQGNPDGTLPTGCPAIGTYPPPVHNAIAIGAFTNLDIDPCDGCTVPPAAPQYRPNNRHLVLFDGRVWWTLKSTNVPPGATVSGSLTDESGNPVQPPVGHFPWEPGDFDLVSTVASTTPGYKTQNSQVYNTIKLTISTTIMKVEMTSRAVLSDGTTVYLITSTMDNIPRQYTGAFDRIRAGVGPGCDLANNNDWSGCATIDGRGCLTSYYDLGHVAFDKFLLYGGAGSELPGACCKADGTCAQMTKAACEALDLNGNPMGHFINTGQACDASVRCCPLFYGDTDQDTDVDMDDFAKLQLCLTAGDAAASNDCRCLNGSGSSGINNDDLLKFVRCANGPGVPADADASCRGPGW